jgi:DNA-binding Xre family transcriptional regulator
MVVDGDNEIRVNLGARMGELDLSISDLARALGVSWPTAQRLRRGSWPRLTGEQFARLCTLLSAQPGDIVSLEQSRGAPGIPAREGDVLPG